MRCPLPPGGPELTVTVGFLYKGVDDTTQSHTWPTAPLHCHHKFRVLHILSSVSEKKPLLSSLKSNQTQKDKNTLVFILN